MPLVNRDGIDDSDAGRMRPAPVPRCVFTKLYATDKPRKFGSFTFHLVGDRLGRRAK